VRRYAATHPFGPFNSVATQLRPIQQAILLLLRRQPELVVEFVSGCSGARWVQRSVLQRWWWSW